VESRLVVRTAGRWSLRSGPLPRRALPPLGQKEWTLLVQGLDLHVDAAHELLARFRFVPDARLDDLMVSYASDGGGVGPHVDSYDVFLLQAQGRRRWRIGRNVAPALDPDAPLKLLKHFVPEHEWLLEPGDMLYLPPQWAHDGVAEGECMTCSIGFQAPRREDLAQQVLQRLLDAHERAEADPMYRDAGAPATAEPGGIPPALALFAADAIQRCLADPKLLACALGEVLSEPKPLVSFDANDAPPRSGGILLDRRTRMMYDAWHVFINGESFRAAGRDAKMMRLLADRRRLTAREVHALSADARALLGQWAAAGWLHESGSPA
jgi:50S ribosomal protein L16 3-hydroxylase